MVGRSLTCRRGHLRTPENIREWTASDGYVGITCRLCHNASNLKRYNFRYRHDDAYRKKIRAKANNYRERKAKELLNACI